MILATKVAKKLPDEASAYVDKKDKAKIRAAIKKKKWLKMINRNKAGSQEASNRLRGNLRVPFDKTREKVAEKFFPKEEDINNANELSEAEMVFIQNHKTWRKCVSEQKMKKQLDLRFRLSFRCPYERECRKVGCALAAHNDARGEEEDAEKRPPGMTEEKRNSCKKAPPPLCAACKKRGGAAAVCKSCEKAKKKAELGPQLVKICPFCLHMMAAYEVDGGQGQKLSMEEAAVAPLRSDKCRRHLRDACDVAFQFTPSLRFFLVFIVNEIVEQKFPSKGKRKSNVPMASVEEALKVVAKLSLKEIRALLRRAEFPATDHGYGDVSVAARGMRLAVSAVSKQVKVKNATAEVRIQMEKERLEEADLDKTARKEQRAAAKSPRQEK